MKKTIKEKKASEVKPKRLMFETEFFTLMKKQQLQGFSPSQL